MQTSLADFIRDTPDGDEADSILRKCVHCGFCTATCPTYQLLGDELDGPRGRIYLIKQMLEGAEVTRKTQLHLDRCLTCRSCETTCPSGVQYGRLLEIGRKQVEAKVERPVGQRLMRYVLARVLPERRLFGPALKVGQLVRPLLPARLRDKIPAARSAGAWPRGRHARKVLMLGGCVQPSMSPNINSATARVLDALGIETVVPAAAGCCGAIRLHLGRADEALDDIRRNIDAWWPYIDGSAGVALGVDRGGDPGVDRGVDVSGPASGSVEALVMNASGCGVTVKEYGHLLRNDPHYAEKAGRISELTVDLSEFLGAAVDALVERATRRPVRELAYHPPCTLQHGQQIRGPVEQLLTRLGIEVKLPADSHLCCGSAGTYSISQPELSYQLRANKLAELGALTPEMIVSANIGCICHLQSGTATPVRHWIELVDEMLGTA